jgi:hypothetical protein
VSRKLVALGLVITALLSIPVGCSSTSKSATGSGKYDILRETVLAGKWQMYQLRVQLGAGADFKLDLLDLKQSDRVDGYFYPERGAGATLEIRAGATPIYHSSATAVPAGGTLSDRFSVLVDQPPGTAYTLTFKNGGLEKDVSVFVEIIYPTTARTGVPLEAK